MIAICVSIDGCNLELDKLYIVKENDWKKCTGVGFRPAEICRKCNRNFYNIAKYPASSYLSCRFLIIEE